MTAVAVEPLRETAQRVLVEAHLGEGNCARLGRAFHVYRELALRELDVEPGPRLSALIATAARKESSRV